MVTAEVATRTHEMQRRVPLLLASIVLALASCGGPTRSDSAQQTQPSGHVAEPTPAVHHAAGPAASERTWPPVGERITHTDAEWRQLLTPAQYEILREDGTEPPGSGEYARHHEAGVYVCAGCGAPLFASRDKFESGTGWPSFTRAFAPGRVDTKSDSTLGMVRNELECARCGGHLGHVFDDGPAPTGQRFCIDSLSLDFVAE